MKEFTVTYLLDDDQIARLEHIKTLYDCYTGTSHDIKKIFAISMIQGCAFDINAHLDLKEKCLISLLADEGLFIVLGNYGGFYDVDGHFVVCEEYGLSDAETDKFAVEVQNGDGYYSSEDGSFIRFAEDC